MKIVIEVGLEDLLEEVEDNESGNTYFEIKDHETFKEDIKRVITEQITNKIRYNLGFNIEMEMKKLVGENKTEIVDRVVKEVSKKIIESKAIHDFKKQLKETESAFIESIKNE